MIIIILFISVQDPIIAVLNFSVYLQPFKLNSLMKFRLLTILASAFIITTALTSCVHEYICQCVISYSGQPGLPDTTVNEYTIKDTKKKAESACEGHSGTYETNGIKTVEDCHLY
jgi:hypothetical protein